jgi:hypothetical protein
MLDLDNAKLPRSVRPLPKRINGHVLSIADLKTIAQYFGGRPDPILGEELVAHVIPGMFDRESGRHIPAAVLHHIGEGDVTTGKRVIRKLIANLKKRPAHYQSGGRAKISQEQVNYRNSTGDEYCAACTMWRPPKSCSAVAGRISRTGVCDLFKARKAAA